MGILAKANIPVGSIQAFAGAAPAGWLACGGQAVSRATYAALFAVIGTTYGAGDGSTTFNVPDLRGRVVFGRDNMGPLAAANRLTTGGSGVDGATLGAVGGGETVTLTTTQLPNHQHGVTRNTTGSGGLSFGTTAFNGGSFPLDNTNFTGGGGAHANIPPALVATYIIKI